MQIALSHTKVMSNTATEISKGSRHSEQEPNKG